MWISVNTFKEIPKGKWQVYLASEMSGNRIQSIWVREKYSNICGRFAEDCPDIIAYQPLPKPPNKD